MKYWVYENWTVCKGGKAKIHKENCRCCNYGRGRWNKGTNNKNGMWHGPFATQREAKQGKLKKVRKAPVPCIFCLGKASQK
ncbi:unnamed protein product [marine sediment metagenome]|uniref:Uncharacterized protein n=1 Tax=marine sediment metagenome TaxID=412755 RepID=X1JFQ9_9ZZZZ